jgi:N-methylhydantoinase A
VSIERGYDPRDFALLAFGGAGPLHACELAAALSIPQVIIPAIPGVLSALGMVVASPARDYSRTLIERFSPGETLSGEWIASSFATLESQSISDMVAEGHKPADLQGRYSLDMRYVGQSHELTVALQPAAYASDPLSLFHQAHQQRYGYARPDAPVEVVTARLTMDAPQPLPQLPPCPAGGVEPPAEAIAGHGPVWFGPDMTRPTAFYHRAALRAGNRISGPAIVFQYDTTTVIPPGWHGQVDSFGNLLLTAG